MYFVTFLHTFIFTKEADQINKKAFKPENNKTYQMLIIVDPLELKSDITKCAQDFIFLE